MSRVTERGWILLEAIFAMACVAFVIAATQHQLNQLTQQMVELQANHQETTQKALYEQMGNLFDHIPDFNTELTVPPRCQLCRGSHLQSVLKYELSQW